MKYLPGVSTVRILEDRCTACGMCTVVCPHAVLAVENGTARVMDRDACMECGACARNCPVEAVSVRAGVGCAQAVINSALGRSSASCCNLEDYASRGPTCETPGEAGCGTQDTPAKARGPGCC